GQAVELPPEPEPPEPIGIFSNGLNQGYPVDLEPGNYRIRLRGADGETVPDSQRSLVIFAPRSTGVGYAIVPESRWTTPEQSSASSDVIFGAAGTSLYLEPHLTWEYPAREWARLQNPQRATGTAGEWEWVTGQLITGGQLEVRAGDRAVHRQKLTPYKVNQIPGAQLGYEVVEMVAGDASGSTSPDFEAFPLHLDTAGEGYQIRLVSETGEVMPGSVRLVRAPASASVTRLLVLPVVPLLLGSILITRRQRRIRPARPLSGS
ncbi:MAG: hypothetical protein ACRDJ9_23465, partial [Dehalococcoidia bacterium]